MFKYWIKNRAIFDVLIPLAFVVLLAFAFILPVFRNVGEAALTQSLSKSEKLDFDVPSPSYEQIAQLENEDCIESVFPYYYTETSLSVGEKTRQSKLFFSDVFDKLGQTMYCEARLIEKATEEYGNPLLVDYQFIQDTGAKLGSTVSVTLGTSKVDFQIAAIYETNTYYSGGAVMAKWEGAQKDAITAVSLKVVYSGAYIQATDHQQCKRYLEEQYKPYGRLRDESEFATHEAYETHYNAFMSGNYANEITDFALKAQEALPTVQKAERSTVTYKAFACVLLVVVMLAYNLLLWMRKSERKYFAKRRISGDKKILVYYGISTCAQSVLLIVGMLLAALIVPATLALYIPQSVVVSAAATFVAFAVAASLLVWLENVLLFKTNQCGKKRSEQPQDDDKKEGNEGAKDETQGGQQDTKEDVQNGQQGETKPQPDDKQCSKGE